MSAGGDLAGAEFDTVVLAEPVLRQASGRDPGFFYGLIRSGSTGGFYVQVSANPIDTSVVRPAFLLEGVWKAGERIYGRDL